MSFSVFVLEGVTLLPPRVIPVGFCLSFCVVVQDTNSSSAIKEMQQGLDENSDGKVSFQEYLTLIGYLANSLSQSKTGSNADAS